MKSMSVAGTRPARLPLAAPRQLWPFCIALSACSTGALELGDGELANPADAPWPRPGVWQGYIEGFQSVSGSDHVRLLLAEPGSGHVVLGDGEPPPLPVDPGNAFDFGDGDYTPAAESNVGRYTYYATPQEGFEYTVEGATLDSERIRLSFRVTEMFDAACAIQTSFLNHDSEGNPFYACLPFGAYWYDTPEGCFIGSERPSYGYEPSVPGTAVSCNWKELCDAHCQCDASTCQASEDWTSTFDATLNAAGDRMEGTMTGLPFGPGRRTVRLRYAE